MVNPVSPALVVVPPDWTPDRAIGLSEKTYRRYFETLQSGQRILIYKAAPVNAIVAEGEVAGEVMVRVDAWPKTHAQERPLTGLGEPADYVLPLRILYTRPSLDYIALSEVKNWADDPAFPNVEWLPLSQDAYEEFTNYPTEI